MMRFAVLYAVGLLLLLASGVHADLPIHCLNCQVAGDWTFHLSSAQSSPDTCGYGQPDRNSDHFDAQGKLKPWTFTPERSVQLTLEEPNEVKQGGTWTLIYDESMEVRATLSEGELTMFSWFWYQPKHGASTQSDDVGDYDSDCSRTIEGWYRLGSRHGCFYGVRAGGEGTCANDTPDPITGKVLNGKSSSDHNKKPALLQQKDAFVPDYSLVDIINRDHTLPYSAKVYPHLAGKTRSDIAKMFGSHRFKSRDTFSTASTATATSFLERASSPFEAVPGAAGLRSAGRDELHARTGGGARRLTALMRRHHHHGRHHSTHRLQHRDAGDIETGPLKHDNNDGSSQSAAVPRRSRPHNEDGSDLPASWDWRDVRGQDYTPPIQSQGSCGSCYAVSFADAFAARAKLAFGEDVRVSAQSVLSCSPYNQGCDGGYPYLVAKHAHDFGILGDACMSYAGDDTVQCDTDCAERYFVEDYGYVGGYYGACSEVAMQREIKERGPIPVAMDASAGFLYYSGGVYTLDQPKHYDQSVRGLNEWEFTNHAVVVIGWGKDENGLKYWIVRNSWGKDWGEDGHFRLRRGTDEGAFESMASWFVVSKSAP